MSKFRKTRKWILCTVYAHEDGKRFFWDNCVEFGDELEERKAKAAEDDLEIVEEVELAVKGKTYKERKDSLYNVGVDYSHFDLDGFSYSEFADVGAWFETNGKRYGLYQEFRENAIC